VIYQITASLSEHHEPKPYGDFGFFNRLDDIELWVFYLENYQLLPFAGAVMDQPSDVLHDIHQYIGIRERLRYEFKEMKR
jgi:hypothetical protein